MLLDYATLGMGQLHVLVDPDFTDSVLEKKVYLYAAIHGNLVLLLAGSIPHCLPAQVVSGQPCLQMTWTAWFDKALPRNLALL